MPHNAEDATLLRVYPLPGGSCELQGLFLAHLLRARATAGRPLVYTNFISTLDGRISWQNLQGRREVPPASTNSHDLELYHELSAQADVLLTSSSHLRAAAEGRAAGMLGYGDSAGRMLQWRSQQGLAPYPRIAAISNSLRLPERARLSGIPGEITILTWRTVDAEQRSKVASLGYRLIVCGSDGEVDGAQLVDALVAEPGSEIRTLYSVAGPRVHSALLRAGRLDRLYLTLAQLMLGGEAFDTSTTGDYFSPVPGFSLAELYVDAIEPDGIGQLFAVFDRR
jgi:riboflavin biosynthesis pyrimidine reductase